MLKNSILKIRTRILEGCRHFWPFHVCLLATAALFVCGIHDVLGRDTVSKLAAGISWGALAGLALRLWRDAKNRPGGDLAVAATTALVAALGCWAWFKIPEIPRCSIAWSLFYGGSLVALESFSVLALYRRANERTLISRLVLNYLVVCAAALVFVSSEGVCWFAFRSLVCKIDEKWLVDIMCVSWTLLVPGGFVALLPDNDSDDRDAERATSFLFWLLLPASLVLLAILYLYLGKILVRGTMPSGTLNWFGSVALAVYTFFWLALRDSTNAFFRRFVRFGWALLIPVLAMQVVGIVIRYNAYGLTSLRLAGMAVLLVGVAALALAALNRPPRHLFYVVAVVGIAFTMTPFNVIDLPLRNQERRLRAAMERNGLVKDGKISFDAATGVPKEDSEIIVSAWNYLTQGWKQDMIKESAWSGLTFTQRLLEALKASSQEGRDLSQVLSEKLGEIRAEARNDERESRQRSFVVSYCVDRSSYVPLVGYTCICIVDRWPNPDVLRRDDGRWIVRIADDVDKKAKPAEYDVTDVLVRFAQKSKQFEQTLSPMDAVWPLSDDLALVVSRFTVCYSTENEDAVMASVIINDCRFARRNLPSSSNEQGESTGREPSEKGEKTLPSHKESPPDP